MRKRRRIEGVELMMRRQGRRDDVDSGVRAAADAAAEDSSYVSVDSDADVDTIAVANAGF